MSETLDYQQIKADSEKLDWETARKEGVTTRERFLELFPTMQEYVEQSEAMHGNFLGTSSLSFTDGRCVFIVQFEKAYQLSFRNPNNEKGHEDTEIVLSYEAMKGFQSLYSIYATDEDTRRFWIAVGVPAEQIEAELALTSGGG